MSKSLSNRGRQGQSKEKRVTVIPGEKTQLTISEAVRGSRRGRSKSRESQERTGREKSNRREGNNGRTIRSRSRSRDREADLKGTHGVKVKLEMIKEKEIRKKVQPA